MGKQSFDQTWEEIHKNQSWGKYPTEHVIRFIARNYYSQERSKIKILDFGCGGERIRGSFAERDLMYMLLTEHHQQ